MRKLSFFLIRRSAAGLATSRPPGFCVIAIDRGRGVFCKSRNLAPLLSPGAAHDYKSESAISDLIAKSAARMDFSPAQIEGMVSGLQADVIPFFPAELFLFGGWTKLMVRNWFHTDERAKKVKKRWAHRASFLAGCKVDFEQALESIAKIREVTAEIGSFIQNVTERPQASAWIGLPVEE